MNEQPGPIDQPSALPEDLLRPVMSWRREESFDVVVVGAGIAGLAFALRLPERTRLAIVTKGALGESNTRYAQGGLAAAVGADDAPELHFEDTLIAGAGLCDPDAVRALVEGGPAAVEWLLAQGTAFDRDAQNRLELGREGAHRRHRVLHAGGDATGFEIERALVTRIRERHIATVYEHATALDLLVSDGRCAGIAMEDHDGQRIALRAGVTVLANGGCGQLWAVTSNPPAATGDGIAMALRAGVTVADLEFTQFHPTVLALPGTTPFLISEAVRGEGAYLRNRAGERFVVKQHPMAELAPRDVVARAIQAEFAPDGKPSVWLDLRHLDAAEMERRFPTIARHLAAQGLSLTRDLLPVAPAAHYFMGGIDAGTDGTTSLPGLLAIGEVSCTGVHGANRLASNSLLEGLVFGLNAADNLGPVPAAPPLPAPESDHALPTLADDEVQALQSDLQSIMSRDVAVVRDEASLDDAGRRLRAIAGRLAGHAATSLPAIELRNMTLLALAMTVSARNRRESRGGHYRSDYPHTDPALDGMHQLVLPGNERVFGPLAEGRLDPKTAITMS